MSLKVWWTHQPPHHWFKLYKYAVTYLRLLMKINTCIIITIIITRKNSTTGPLYSYDTRYSIPKQAPFWPWLICITRVDGEVSGKIYIRQREADPSRKSVCIITPGRVDPERSSSVAMLKLGFCIVSRLGTRRYTGRHPKVIRRS